MLAYRANETAFLQIEKPVKTYLEHWLDLVERGLPNDAVIGIDSTSLVQRDQLHRQALFNPTIDPVWDKLAPLIGTKVGARIREILKSQIVER